MDREETEELSRGRARARRLARMKGRGLSLVRPACLSCSVLALLWLLGLGPRAIVAAALGLAGLALLVRLVGRGRTLR